MRAKLAGILGLAILLISTVPGLTQMPGGGGWGKGGRGMRNFGGDPGQMFDQWTGGKTVWVRAEITDSMQQMIFDRTALRMNITSGQITRDEFVSSAKQRMAQMGGGADAAAPAPGAAAPGPAPGGNANWMDTAAESMFRRQDQNQDGYLNNDEMPETLRAELDKWDTDKNGLIDLNEFKAWFQARMQQMMNDRNAANGNSGQSEERQPPVAYRVGKLPKELPAWFAQLDTDQDAQIGLYEWKASGRSLDEFNKIDRNGDGFLTVDEVLRYEASQGRGPQQFANGAPAMPPASGSASMVMAPGSPGGWGGPMAVPGGQRFMPGGNDRGGRNRDRGARQDSGGPRDFGKGGGKGKRDRSGG